MNRLDPRAAPAALRHAALVLVAVMVFLLFDLGSQPVAVGLLPEPWDKLAHFVAFAGLATLLSIGLGGTRPVVVLLAIAAIGACDEWHQATLPGRSADLFDWLTDIGAAVCALAFLELVGRSRVAPAGPTA